MAEKRPLLLLIGAAEGFGVSLARVFAAAGYDVVGLSRSDRIAADLKHEVASAGGNYTHVICDITDAALVADVLTPYRERVDVLIHNAHQLKLSGFGDTSHEEFAQMWRVSCFGAMVVAKEIIPAMEARKSGVIILSGATASIRGGAKTSAFAAAKFALRGLAQSLAREYAPHGIHVAHVILDGLIDEPQTEHRFGAKTIERMSPDDLANAYLQLANQPPSTWTHELDLRPYSEKF